MLLQFMEVGEDYGRRWVTSESPRRGEAGSQTETAVGFSIDGQGPRQALPSHTRTLPTGRPQL